MFNVVFGNLCIIVALAINVVQISRHLLEKKSKEHRMPCKKKFVTQEVAKVTCLLLAILTLAWAFLENDTRLLVVYGNTSSITPFIYKISAIWSNHEGSMLLWNFFLSLFSAIFSYIFLSNVSSKNPESECLYIHRSSIYNCAICLVFLLLMLLTSNPFALNPNFKNAAGQALGGLGFNPILQDYSVSIHPIMLYIGYASTVLVYTASQNISLKLHSYNLYLSIIYKLSKVSFSFITLGIALGAQWAYRELGWGGYWFWDAVENISLMPWLLLLCMLHMKPFVARAPSSSIQKIFVILSGAVFVSIVMGFFVVRSGLLTSVHSFVGAAYRGISIAAIGAFLALFVISNFFKCEHKEAKEDFSENFKEKYVAQKIVKIFSFVCVCTCLAAFFVVTLGVFIPLIVQIVGVQLTIDENYYKNFFRVFALIVVVGIFASNLLYFKTSLLNASWKARLGFFLTCAACALLSLKYIYQILIKNQEYLVLDLQFDVLAVIIHALIIIIAIMGFVAALFFIRGSKIFWPHVGFLCVMLGIGGSSLFATEQDFSMKQGDRVRLAYSLALNLKRIFYYNGNNYIARGAEFSVLHKEIEEIAVLRPATHFYPEENQQTIESDMESWYFGDIYTIIGNKDADNSISVRVYTRPLVNLIWIGSVIIFLCLIVRVARFSKPKSNRSGVEA